MDNKNEKETECAGLSAPAVCSAFLRTCDQCGAATAIDLDPTPERWREMAHFGDTVRTLPQSEAMEIWHKSERCNCFRAVVTNGPFGKPTLPLKRHSIMACPLCGEFRGHSHQCQPNKQICETSPDA